LTIEVAIASLIAVLNVLIPTILLLGLSTASLWLRRLTWLDMGLRRPASWRKMALSATALAFATTAFGLWIARPAIAALTGEVQDFSQFREVQGSWQVLILWLAISWILGAFGEEMVFRGYLLNRSLDLFGLSWPGHVASVLLNAAVFGALHRSQGPGGMMNTAVDACMFSIIYFLGRRNLWLTILVHGIGNSLGLIAFYFGWFGLLK
jgi:membrane protease YdiL (CAAX protease family)